jgi:lipopolysaccharide export system protein LptC
MELDEMRRSKAEDRARRARAMDEQRVIDAKHVEDESVLRKEMTVRVASDAEHVKQAEEDIRSTRKVSAVPRAV